MTSARVPKRPAPGGAATACRRAWRGVVVLTLLVAFGSASVQAQPLGGFDVEPPLIEHEVVPFADAAFRQSFIAQVADDNDLASVTLYWRYAGEIQYAALPMNQVSRSSTRIAQLPTSPQESRAIEYYIEARDAGGNRTVRGFVFSPLIRQIVNAEGSSAFASEPAVRPPTVERRRVVYYVLGALAVGLIAGFVSRGDGADEDPIPSECGGDGCDVVITFQSPVVQ